MSHSDGDPYTTGYIDGLDATRPALDRLQTRVAEAERSEAAAWKAVRDAKADAAEAQYLLRETHAAIRTGTS